MTRFVGTGTGNTPVSGFSHGKRPKLSNLSQWVLLP